MIELALDVFLTLWFITALAFSAALTTSFPHIAGWANVSRSIAWPVTLYEIHKGLL